ncbi:putative methyltransferase [Helianthus debilis subsp. tardiflorus]
MFQYCFQARCIPITLRIRRFQGFETVKERTYSKGITIQFKDEEESSAFHGAFEQWKCKSVTQGSSLPNGTVSSSKSKFDDKIEASSAKMYFHYYGQLLHQQNMMKDYVRTAESYLEISLCFICSHASAE